ncbi:unnamed protein product [Brassicogethes aeneus]|uniref:Death domain-containing protein n=1 Tax=Brassicogethes aeneus TaxID=1431903 RepID=A0A9P0BL38_BRAAE|nr:unnamed protein product [Brassicogethes aeneus]
MDYNFDLLRIEYRDVLEKSFKIKKINKIEDKVKSINRTDIDLKTPLDQAFRDYLLKLLEDEVHVEKLKEYVQFCIDTCRRGLTGPTLPVVLLGDIFEALTLDMCKEMFGFVENNVQVWKEDLFFTSCKNHLLRLCNDLLRRLSRSTATVFCGKILLFLAKFFPFSERSGLNIVSEFNFENITEYTRDAGDDEYVKEIPGDQKNIVIDFTFYCKFWQLQDFFRNPNQCYSKVEWKQFCAHSTSILNTFQGIKIDYVNTEENSNKGYFAKYLTSQKLLDLQLYDVNFRRSVLLQFLVVFQYLTSSVKFKSDSYELKTEQKEWIATNKEKIYSLLKDTPPDGDKFAEIAKKILGREELWNAWKNDGCPEIKKNFDISEPKENENRRPLLGDILKEANKEGRFYMGSGELTKLWNHCPNNLEACKGKERDFLPSLEDYFSEIIESIENISSLKDDDNLLKDGNFGWRALRLLARRSPHFFTYSNTIMNPLSSYLEMMVRKIASEKPGLQEQNENNQNDNELEENLLTEEEPQSENLQQDNTEDFVDDNNPRSDNKGITETQMQLFCMKIAADWEKLAVKLGYKPDEIEFFKNENPTEIDQAKNMLQLWFEDDEDATMDNFLYILEGLNMTEAAEVVRNEISNTMDTN